MHHIRNIFIPPRDNDPYLALIELRACINHMMLDHIDNQVLNDIRHFLDGISQRQSERQRSVANVLYAILPYESRA